MTVQTLLLLSFAIFSPTVQSLLYIMHSDFPSASQRALGLGQLAELPLLCDFISFCIHLMHPPYYTFVLVFKYMRGILVLSLSLC